MYKKKTWSQEDLERKLFICEQNKKTGSLKNKLNIQMDNKNGDGL